MWGMESSLPVGAVPSYGLTRVIVWKVLKVLVAKELGTETYGMLHSNTDNN